MTEPQMHCGVGSRHSRDEMEKWEKTLPGDVWVEFARLTNWTGDMIQRPKYWDKPVYGHLDSDVANGLKRCTGAEERLELSSMALGQYGLIKLVEPVWILIGTAKTRWKLVVR